jgi:predicted SprT family Zn-dependent metalloprotease
MDAHGLTGWTLEPSRAVKQLGVTLPARKVIRISRSHIELNERDAVLDTVLHEIAHALVAERGGSLNGDPHGPAWQRVAQEIGVETISYRVMGVKMPKGRYSGTCPCGTPHERWRMRPGWTYRCATCKGLIEWSVN